MTGIDCLDPSRMTREELAQAMDALAMTPAEMEAWFARNWTTNSDPGPTRKPLSLQEIRECGLRPPDGQSAAEYVASRRVAGRTPLLAALATSFVVLEAMAEIPGVGGPGGPGRPVGRTSDRGAGSGRGGQRAANGGPRYKTRRRKSR